MKKDRIRHMVIFCLKHEKNAPETQKFLEDGQAILSALPTVENFEVLRQISVKNDYEFGFSMEFSNRSAYEEYNSHSLHIGFVRDRWQKEVSRFLEIDFQV